MILNGIVFLVMVASFLFPLSLSEAVVLLVGLIMLWNVRYEVTLAFRDVVSLMDARHKSMVEALIVNVHVLVWCMAVRGTSGLAWPARIIGGILLMGFLVKSLHRRLRDLQVTGRVTSAVERLWLIRALSKIGVR